MSRNSRFSSANDVFEAFPAARDDIDVPPTDEAAAAYFMRSLMASDTPEDTVAFCAYLLPRREAVWWGCQSVKSLHPAARSSEEDQALAAAEAWVREPEEERRAEAGAPPRHGEQPHRPDHLARPRRRLVGRQHAAERPADGALAAAPDRPRRSARRC